MRFNEKTMFDELSISHFFERNGSGKKTKTTKLCSVGVFFFVDPLISYNIILCKERGESVMVPVYCNDC